jgi:hypothetical protein
LTFEKPLMQVVISFGLIRKLRSTIQCFWKLLLIRFFHVQQRSFISLKYIFLHLSFYLFSFFIFFSKCWLLFFLYMSCTSGKLCAHRIHLHLFLQTSFDLVTLYHFYVTTSYDQHNSLMHAKNLICPQFPFILKGLTAILIVHISFIYV